MTALHQAVLDNNYTVVKILLLHGAVIDLQVKRSISHKREKIKYVMFLKSLLKGRRFVDCPPRRLRQRGGGHCQVSGKRDILWENGMPNFATCSTAGFPFHPTIERGRQENRKRNGTHVLSLSQILPLKRQKMDYNGMAGKNKKENFELVNARADEHPAKETLRQISLPTLTKPHLFFWFFFRVRKACRRRRRRRHEMKRHKLVSRVSPIKTSQINSIELF